MPPRHIEPIDELVSPKNDRFLDDVKNKQELNFLDILRDGALRAGPKALGEQGEEFRRAAKPLQRESPDPQDSQRPAKPPEKINFQTERVEPADPKHDRTIERPDPAKRDSFGERGDTALDKDLRPIRIGGATLTWDKNNNISSIVLADGVRFDPDERGFLVGTKNGKVLDNFLLPGGSINISASGVEVIAGNGGVRVSIGISETAVSPAWRRMVALHEQRRNGS